MMRKFLIIVKFVSPQDFCHFYQQFTTGQVLVPLSQALPEKSRVVLKLIIPEIEDYFTQAGTVAAALPVDPEPDADSSRCTSVQVTLDKNFRATVSDIRRFLGEIDFYRHLVDPDALVPEIPDPQPLPDIEAPPAEELSGIEMAITEDDIQVLEAPLPAAGGDLDIAQAENPPADDADAGDTDGAGDKALEEELLNLKMENDAFNAGVRLDDIAGDVSFSLMDEAEEKQFQEKQACAPVSTEIEVDFETFDFQDGNPPPDAGPASEDVAADMQPPDAREDMEGWDEAAVYDEVYEKADDDAGGVAFEDLKQMVDQAEFEIESEPEPALETRRIPEKKDLTPEERAKAEPVGQFFMNLTKAMLRSGYYAPGHPGADSAKAGLYEEFTTVLGDQREIMVTDHTTRDGIDLMITGILDEPVSIRVLVGPGVAELFVPKLSDYCERKQLLSFALKNEISPAHFYEFIDIMSDPKVDDHKGDEAGKFLTTAFIERGITNISTVFVDDMVKLETDLPWRVEMAIHRLAKDLKVMPMFKNVSGDAIKKMKLQTVQDIIRPLKHPAYLNDFLVNCYIIAKYVKDMPAEEIEEMVVEAFSLKLLIPTSRFTFKELDSLKQLRVKHPENDIIDRRLAGIRRILKLMSRRVVKEEAAGARHFLEYLYRNEILSFNELPADVQFMINTMKMADDVRDNFSRYADGIKRVKNPEDALVYVKCFRRVMPVLIERNEWKTIKNIAAVIQRASAGKPVNTEKMHSGLKIVKSDGEESFAGSGLFGAIESMDRPAAFIFKDVTDKIIAAYEQAGPSPREFIDKIIDNMGSFGVDIISRMLTESNDREVRKQSFEIMKQKGWRAKKWAEAILNNLDRPWYIHRNALMILSHVSDRDEDFSVVRNFLTHPHAKLREEALNLTVSMKPRDGETLILNAIGDDDPKVRWRAMRSLPEISSISESAMEALLAMIVQPLPKETEAADKQMKQTVQIVTAINAMSHIPVPQKVEADLLGLVQSLTEGKKSLWHRVKKAVAGQEELRVLKAVVPLLGRIGGTQSGSTLKKISRQYPDLSELADKAVDQITDRNKK